MKHALRFTGCVLTLTLATFAAQAQTKTLAYGQTTVTLDSNFVAALGTLGLTPGVVQPSTLSGTTLTFPVTGGAVDASTARGEIAHSGGLTLTAGSTAVRLQSFTIDTTNGAVLNGLVVVNGSLISRVPLFRLQLPANLTVPLAPSADGVLAFKGVGMLLTGQAASALNSFFKTNALKEGTLVGTADVTVLLANFGQ